jgi:ABC-type cobalamin/Fe3+-siderophores transport system ATPase subunit
VTDRSIELRDVGPVEHITIPIPIDGGLVVLRGRNGLGKSHCLRAVSGMIDGKTKPVTRDGALGAQAEGLGVRVTVGRRTTLSGELEVHALEGEDPSTFVDPGIKSDDAADAARMKALLRLAGVKVDVSAFGDLVGGVDALREICRETSLVNKNDITEMAASVKRDIELAARKAEQQAENLKSEAAGARLTLEKLGAQPNAACTTKSADAARSMHTEAVRTHAALEATIEQNAKLRRAGADARAQRDEMGDDGTPDGVERAEQKVRAAADAAKTVDARLAEANAEIHRLELEIERAKSTKREIAAELGRAQSDVDEAHAAATRQNRAVEQRAALQRAIDAGDGIAEIPADELAALSAKITGAETEIQRWAIDERTTKIRADIADLDLRGRAMEESGMELRNAARGTERVVLDAVRSVCGEDIELHEGRLYVKTDRGSELFSELSQGERWRIALEISTKAVGKHGPGLLVVRQEAFESLDPENRRVIDEHAKRLGVVILTAEAADGEIRAEVFEPAHAEAGAP